VSSKPSGAFSRQLEAVQAADAPAFKTDPLAGAESPTPTAPVRSASRGAGEEPETTPRNWRTKSRPRRITLDLTELEYDQLRRYRTVDVNTSAILRGCIELLKRKPELLAEVRELGAASTDHP
jgi:hypothetical protein